MNKRLQYIRYIGLIVLALVALIVSSGNLFAGGKDLRDPRVVTLQDENSSQMPDNAILADETGLPVERVNEAIAFQETFTEHVGELINRFPDEISGAWMDSPPGNSGPSTRGHLRFTGEVPPGLESMENVSIAVGGDISISDHYRRNDAVALALIEQGYQNFITFFAPERNVIQIEILLPEGTPQPSKSVIVDAAQDSVQSDQDLRGRAAIIKSGDLALTVIRGSGPILSDHHSRGGNWLRENGSRECTSGWSVSGPDGDGIMTAGHCDGVDQFEQPDVDPYSMVLEDAELGEDGDVAYFTTTHAELAEFYADATTIRAVTSIKTTSTMVSGGSVCFYGRASNARTCNQTVVAVNVSIYTSSCSCNVGNLARTDTHSTIDGDSGGGWSFNHAAWGVHKGSDFSVHGYFTTVEEAQTVLNVTIKT